MAERVAGEQLAGRAGIALRVAGALTAAVSGVVAGMDIVGGGSNMSHKQWALGSLQIVSGLTGSAAAAFSFWAAIATEGGATVFAGLSLTGWGVVLAVALVALAMVIDHVRGDDFAQWLERCFWGELASGRYVDQKAEQSDFSKLMAAA
jgi:hypothetical protein